MSRYSNKANYFNRILGKIDYAIKYDDQDEAYTKAKAKCRSIVEAAENELEQEEQKAFNRMVCNYSLRFQSCMNGSNDDANDHDLFNDSDPELTEALVNEWFQLIAAGRNDEANALWANKPKSRTIPRRAFTDDDRRVLEDWFYMEVEDKDTPGWPRKIKNPKKSYKKLLDGSKMMPNTALNAQWMEFKKYLLDKIEDKEAGMSDKWWVKVMEHITTQDTRETEYRKTHSAKEK